MSTLHVSKTEFKARALELFRQVEATGEPIVVTDHGKPALEIRPYRAAPQRDPLEVLRGSVLRFDDPLSPVGDDVWEAAQ
ncbi:prevent-host-death protein [Achromobacter sp. HZ01]|uniref:type II toxin-antitoxin system Phd/YefM family antitoxin n=1 Tax=Achromobacter sp. HZ01 TaxID=1416886 RepID=UPI000DC5A769|nr:type II toxin-antitoxin system Phd/YefM family antitoxin [Achromobacter sp. HZ01]MBO9331197.1 type II toxin-antitoxin system prevent-host-death family antitoxin [Achromobacter xylosoxidans]RAP62303.1 prevent-host-death protein [Achromobacter sp. HZ01]